MKRFLPWLIVIGGLLLIAFVIRHLRTGGAATYQTANVARGQITQAVTATGTLNPVLNVQVGSQVSGNISKLFADFNSQVKAGQVVAQIDPALFQATVTQAEGDLASAQAALELARVNAKRTQELFARKTSSQADLDQALANLHQAEANIKIKQGALDKAKEDVDFTVDAFPMRTFHGKVVQVRNAPITVQNVVTYDTVIGVSNPDLKLKPGMTANVSIIIARKDNVLQLKNAALRYRPADAGPPSSQNAASQGGSRPPGAMRQGRQGMGRREQKTSERTVYALSGSHLTPVQIKTGISDGVVTEVVEGLKEGDRVVTAEMAAKSQPASSPANPFSGGQRRFP